jgi:protein-tyrosine phosphatase
MIDIHTHILPEVDDGARNLDEAVEMCTLAARDGVSVMVATPHAHDGVHTTHETSFLEQQVAELASRLNGRPRIVLGSELRFTHAVVNHVCVEKSAPTINGGPYVLVEFPHSVVPLGSERALFELMSNGIKPVIAHPERNRQLMAEPERLLALIEMGVLGQLDAGSLTGQFGKKVTEAARTMIEHGLIHFIASDCHNTRNRVPGISGAMNAAAEIVGDEYARAMVDGNPAAVVDGKPIPVRPSPIKPQKKRRWIFF